MWRWDQWLKRPILLCSSLVHLVWGSMMHLHSEWGAPPVIGPNELCTRCCCCCCCFCQTSRPPAKIICSLCECRQEPAPIRSDWQCNNSRHQWRETVLWLFWSITVATGQYHHSGHTASYGFSVEQVGFTFRTACMGRKPWASVVLSSVHLKQANRHSAPSPPSPPTHCSPSGWREQIIVVVISE